MRPYSAPHRRDRTAGQARLLDHESLLTIARRVHAAASDGDAPRLEMVIGAFIDAFARHLRAEAGALGRLTPGEYRVLRKGQDRIAATAAALWWDARHAGPEVCRGCQRRAEELLMLLTLQADDERHAWLRLAV